MSVLRESEQPSHATKPNKGSEDSSRDPTHMVDKLIKLKRYVEELKLTLQLETQKAKVDLDIVKTQGETEHKKAKARIE